MANISQITGALSELTAARALMANGWEVSRPMVDEPYDLVAKDPVNGEFVGIQVKTIRRRTDRKNEMVAYTTNGRGEPYDPSVCAFIVAVEKDTAYMFENEGLREVWASDRSAAKRWVKLTEDSGAPTNLTEAII